MPKRVFLTLTIGLVLLAVPASACPNCRDAVSREGRDPSSGPGGLAKGFNRSIAAMIAMPALLLGAGSIGIVRAARRGLVPPL
jgi:hypothetical protein